MAKKDLPVVDGISIHCSYDELVPIEKLIPHPQNPHQHPEKQIEKLEHNMKALGWRVPITVSRRSGFIIRGHCRLAVAQRMALSKCPVDYQEYENEATEWLDLLGDNVIEELGKWDRKMIKDQLQKYDDGEIDLGISGFSEEEIGEMFTKYGDEYKNPDYPIATELMEAHNYIVLYFDNELEWNTAQDIFGIRTEKASDSREGYERKGIGRVISGKDILRRLQE